MSTAVVLHEDKKYYPTADEARRAAPRRPALPVRHSHAARRRRRRVGRCTGRARRR